MTEIEDALKIAMTALKEKNLRYRNEFRLTASRVGSEWVFWFVFLPPTEGMDVTVMVGDDGNIRTLVGM